MRPPLAPGCAHPSSYLGGECYGGASAPQHPDEPAGFWQWTLDGADLTITPQALSGWLDSVDGNNIATGWAYDPDTGTNDAAANGSASAPLGHDTWVRPVAISTVNGQEYEGQWQSAQVERADLVINSAAPDPYHGFRIDLTTQGFPPGTYRVHVEGGEFPSGMGGTGLFGDFTVTIAAPCVPPSITSNTTATTITSGETVQLTGSGSGTSPLTYQWYIGAPPNALNPLPAGATVNVSPSSTTDYWLRVVNSCGQASTQAVRLTVVPASTPAGLYTLTPCRVLDTRGGLPIAAGGSRDVQISGACGVPSGTRAAALNLTAVLPSSSGFLTLYPADASLPMAISMAYRTGKTRATGSIVRISPSGALRVYNNGPSAIHVLIDINSYFR